MPVAGVFCNFGIRTRLQEVDTGHRLNLREYRNSQSERARTADLIGLLPANRRSVLDVGARDGHFSNILTGYFAEVTALDLQKPSFEIPGVVTVEGDATKLNFPDESFDCVFCAEVLEHIPNVEQACREITRVARHEVIIGVPFQQDTRIGRTLCGICGKVNPPWGHVNTFDERRLQKLFPGLSAVRTSYVGTTKSATNPVSALLMDIAGHPWGVYLQEEPCIGCGSELIGPPARSFTQKVCSALAVRLDSMQSRFTKTHANWVHMVLRKHRTKGAAIKSVPA